MSKALQLYLVAAAAVLLVLFNTWLADRQLDTLFAAESTYAHTLRVLSSTADAQVQMASANSSARGFLLGGDPLLLERYRMAERNVQNRIDELRVQTTDNPTQRPRLDLFQERVAARTAALDAAIAVRRQHPESPIPDSILRPAIAESPDNNVSPRFAIQQVADEEHRLLDQRADAALHARSTVTWTFTLASLLDVVLLVLTFRYVARVQSDRVKLEASAAQIGTLNKDLLDLNADLESRVEARTRELENANRELQAFSYSVSHDLRAPLRTIDGFSLALEEDFSAVLDNAGRDYIRRVRAGVQRMGTLIDALLTLSRVTRSELKRQQVDLSQLATQVYTDLRINDAQREVTFTAQPGMHADADPHLMRVAFENLLGNALKFTSKTPSAHIEFGQILSGGQTVYFVRDNGAGFDMQYVDRLFTAFQRLHGDREFTGSGIGLATVSRIISLHHGEISAEGKPGAGAVFRFTLGPGA